MAWALQDAKARFSEVVRKARTEGPQEVTVRGEPAVVVIAAADLARLRDEREAPTKSLEQFLLEGEPWPDWFADAVNERSKDPGREIEL